MNNNMQMKPSGRICLSEGLSGFQEMAAGARAACTGSLLLDLSEVTYIDSSGLGEILKLYLELKNINRKLILVAPQPAIRKVLRSSKLDRVFPMAETMAEATGK